MLYTLILNTIFKQDTSIYIHIEPYIKHYYFSCSPPFKTPSPKTPRRRDIACAQCPLLLQPETTAPLVATMGSQFPMGILTISG